MENESVEYFVDTNEQIEDQGDLLAKLADVIYYFFLKSTFVF